MNVFLPFSDYRQSIKDLDKRRGFKQVIECKQIINTLEGKSEGWKNHPATVMYRGHINSLKRYYNICLQHCIDFWKIKVVKLQPYDIIGPIEHPEWLGFPMFHSVMRANLVRKDSLWYKYQESPQEGYFWPCNKDGSLKDEVKTWKQNLPGT